MISGHIDIAVFDDRVEIWSPGRLPDGIRLKDLNKKHKSVLRNPAIAEMLYFTGYVERWGSGIQKINTLIKDAELPEPAYEEIGSNFVVTLYKTKASTSEGLNEGLKTLYKTISDNPGIKAKDLSTKFNDRSLATIERQINALIELNLIERKGSRKAGGYYTITIKNK
ncbi:ATP-binding protein [bacterium]